jgi:hypothetical protein
MSNEAAQHERVQVHVFVNRKKVELDSTTVTGAELLRDAGFEGTHWDLFQLQGEGDPTGGELVLADQPLQLKNGDRFRVIPGDRTFGAQSHVA